MVHRRADQPTNQPTNRLILHGLELLEISLQLLFHVLLNKHLFIDFKKIKKKKKNLIENISCKLYADFFCKKKKIIADRNTIS